MTSTITPLARGPLIDRHRAANARFEMRDGWQVAIWYPREPEPGRNALVDLSHWPTFELNGPGVDAGLQSLGVGDVPLRRIERTGKGTIYRLTPSRAILFGGFSPPPGALDVTGGWATLALCGPDCEALLNKVTALDLRLETLPVGGCCQGPIFGVNTLFGRFENRFELHVCSDSAQFFWDVLMDAGREFDLEAAGADWYRTTAAGSMAT